MVNCRKPLVVDGPLIRRGLENIRHVEGTERMNEYTEYVLETSGFVDIALGTGTQSGNGGPPGLIKLDNSATSS